jgi:factor associated with neutral sphingomyelinase activation
VHALEDFRQLRSVNLSSLSLSGIAVSGDGKTCAVSSWDNNIYIYSLDYGRTVETWQAHDDAVSSMHSAAGLVVTGSWDSSVRVWAFGDAPSGRKQSGGRGPVLHDLVGNDGEVRCVVLSAGGTRAASGSAQGRLLVWELGRGTLLADLIPYSDEIRSIAFSPDGQIVVCCSSDTQVKVRCMCVMVCDGV